MLEIIIISTILLAIGLAGVYMRWTRIKAHEEYVSRMPPGVIPDEKRPGNRDPEISQKWRKARREASAFPYTEELYDPVELGLTGNWSFPILSKEERLQWYETTSRKMNERGNYLLIIGAISIVVAVLLSILLRNLTCLMALVVGFTMIPLELFFRWKMKKGKEIIEKDELAETAVNAVTKDHKALASEIQSLLDSKGIKYKKEVKSLDDMGHIHHEYKFLFPDGNFVRVVHYDIGSGSTSVAIAYHCAHCQSARKIQSALDMHLVEKKMILRAK